MERRDKSNEKISLFPFKLQYDAQDKMAYIDYGDKGELVTDFSEEEEFGRLVDKVGDKIVGVEFLNTTLGLNVSGIPFEKEVREYCAQNGVLVTKEI